VVAVVDGVVGRDDDVDASLPVVTPLPPADAGEVTGADEWDPPEQPVAAAARITAAHRAVTPRPRGVTRLWSWQSVFLFIGLQTLLVPASSSAGNTCCPPRGFQDLCERLNPSADGSLAREVRSMKASLEQGQGR
jgi:hypothetical protein